MENVAVGQLLGSMYRASHAFVLDRLKNSDIGFGQYPFLMYLKDHPGVNQEKMASELCFDKGTTTRALQKLEEKGLINRLSAAKDRRRLEVELTAEGKRLCKIIARAIDEWNEVLMKGVVAAKREVALQVLRAMLDNMLIAVGKKDSETKKEKAPKKSIPAGPAKKTSVPKKGKAKAAKHPAKKAVSGRGKAKR